MSYLNIDPSLSQSCLFLRGERVGREEREEMEGGSGPNGVIERSSCCLCPASLVLLYLECSVCGCSECLVTAG